MKKQPETVPTKKHGHDVSTNKVVNVEYKLRPIKNVVQDMHSRFVFGPGFLISDFYALSPLVEYYLSVC